MRALWQGLQTLWRRQRRWQQADRRGWGMLGALYAESRRRPDSFRAHWLIRNMNRLYRLTRGHGNPWRPYRGF